MKINASITANYFLRKGIEEKRPITLMKLLKLVYIAHGWVLAVLDNNEGALGDENIEAWKHGPVTPSLYHEFKHYQNLPIDEWSQTTTQETESDFKTESIHLKNCDIEEKNQFEEIFSAVWEAYKEYSAWGLSQKTHEIGSPWEKNYNPEKKGTVIPNQIIKEYYRDYLQQLMESIQRRSNFL